MSRENEAGSSLELQQDLVGRIARGLASHQTAPWENITYEAQKLFPYSEDMAYVTTPEGEVVAAYPPNETYQLVSQLRSVMYQESAGTWFTFTLTIRKPGTVDANFDYENEPSWEDPVEPVFYVQDLERFPRDEANIPQWLARELERGREQDAAYDKIKGPRKRITPITAER